MHGQHSLVNDRAARHEQLTADHRLLRLADRQRLPLLVGGVDGAARVHQHGVDVGIRGALDGFRRIGGQRTAGDQQLGTALQLVVDVGVQRRRHHRVHRDGHQHHDHGHHRHGQQHHPPSQGQRRGGFLRAPDSTRAALEDRHQGLCSGIRVESRAAHNPPRARCGSAAVLLLLRSCDADNRRTPRAHYRRWESRNPTPPRGCGCA